MLHVLPRVQFVVFWGHFHLGPSVIFCMHSRSFPQLLQTCFLCFCFICLFLSVGYCFPCFVSLFFFHASVFSSSLVFQLLRPSILCSPYENPIHPQLAILWRLLSWLLISRWQRGENSIRGFVACICQIRFYFTVVPIHDYLAIVFSQLRHRMHYFQELSPILFAEINCIPWLPITLKESLYSKGCRSFMTLFQSPI
ncbi:hypothetical protein GmHk_12G034802 [Glycine max]|nr:hypothetical protein GmHk_12G034802 [Glycine max]